MTERFKFVRELQLCHPDKHHQAVDPKASPTDSHSSTKDKLVYCHFSTVREQTPNEEANPFKDYGGERGNQGHNIYQKNDQRCYIKGNALKIYSRGGSEFIVPIHFQVLNVFPINDGIIVKAQYDRDLVQFDASLEQSRNYTSHRLRAPSLNQPMRQSQQKLNLEQDENGTFAYFTLTNHPLDDIHPLAWSQTQEQPFINTTVDILHVSYKIPFLVLYDKETKTLSFGLLKNIQSTNENNSKAQLAALQVIDEDDDESYIRSIEPESRHPELYNISNESKLFVQEVYSEKSVQEPPTKIFLQKGLTNPFELVVTLYFKEKKTLQFLSCDLRQPKVFQTKLILNGIQDVSKVLFSRQNYTQQRDSVAIISKQLRESLDFSLQDEKTSPELKFLKKRIKLLKKDLVVIENNSGRVIHFYQGYQNIHTLDLGIQQDPMASSIVPSSQFSRQLSLAKNARIESFSHPHKSNMTINIQNGESRRITFELRISDYLVYSIMKTLKAFLPEQLYLTITQDLINTFTKTNSEQNSTTGEGYYDQFTKFCNMLLSFLTGSPQQLTLPPPAIIRKNTATTLPQATPVVVTHHQPPVHQIQPNKPAQALQTRILRSSTAQMGGVSSTTDTLARKKLQTTAGQGFVQSHQQTQMASGVIQKPSVRTNLGMRSAAGGPGQLSATLTKKMMFGSSEQHMTQSINTLANTQHGSTSYSSTGGFNQGQFGVGTNIGASQIVGSATGAPFISSNPFADLLNSDFHRDNFDSHFKQLFPSDVKLAAPSGQEYLQQNPQPNTGSFTNQAQSPTKTMKPSINSTSNNSTQKITSTKQSSIVGGSVSSVQGQDRKSFLTSGTNFGSQGSSANAQIGSPTSHSHMPSYKTSRQDFLAHSENIFLVLHLLYEDIKLNKMREAVESPKLAKLLIKWILITDPYKKQAYLDYYLKENETLQHLFEADIKKYVTNSSPNSSQETGIDPVPKLYRWLESRLKKVRSNYSYPFPLFFEKTRKICRLYEILSGGTQPSNTLFSPLLAKNNKLNQVGSNNSQQYIQTDHQTLNGLIAVIKGGVGGSTSQYRNNGADWLTSFTNMNDYLMRGQLGDLHLFEKILFCLKEENLSLEEVKKLPAIISLPILEIIRYARLFQQEIQSVPKWPDSLYKLIHREDILNNLRLFERATLGGQYKGGREVIRESLQEQLEEDVDETGAVVTMANAPGGGGTANPTAGGPGTKSKVSSKSLSQFKFQKYGSKNFALNRGMTNVFSAQTEEEIQLEEQRKEMQSNILQTAAGLLESSTQDQYGEGVSTNKSQKDNIQSQKQVAEFLKNRFNNDTRYKEVFSMLSSSREIVIKLEQIKSHESMSEERLHTLKQALLDKLFFKHLAKCVGRGALTFGTMQTIPTETLQVPKINQTGYIPQTESYMSVEFKDDSSGKELTQWPEFHNGVASALKIARGLRKEGKNQPQHTRNWIMYHKPAEPKYEHGGFLLAIGLLGQLDTLQPTDIYQHLKSTHDATAIGILLGRAASKIGTMDDQDTRTLCIHIPYLLPPSLSIDISLAIQSAAVIGAGLLYKGTSNRLMTEMLLAQIGRKPLSDKAIEREGYALASGIALGLVNLGVGSQMQGISDLKLNERLIRFVEGGKTIDLPQSMLSTNFNHDNTKCSAIKEGDMVNVHITSPGALIALALIHLKSNNEQIAGKLQMPQTFYSLEFVRPAFLLLKVLCKNLIMWDQIHPSEEWILSQIPEIIRVIYENDIGTVEKKYCQQISEEEIDYSTVALCYVNTVAGALFSLGFKFAGTGNKQVHALLAHYTHNYFRKLKVMKTNKDQIGVIHNNMTKNQVDKHTVETCLCVCAFAMSMVMAGTGDVECFRSLRVIRKKLEGEMHYGFNMAIHLSLGFLFLGSGAYTFSRNNLAIAALLCSLYPIFPSTPSDNRYHLQALRHFYVLAIETRLLQARDIDSGEFVNIELDVEIEEITPQSVQWQEHQQQQNSNGANIGNNYGTSKGQPPEIRKVKLQTPAIINGRIRKIEVNNDQYHYICLTVRQQPGQVNGGDRMDIDSGAGAGAQNTAHNHSYEQQTNIQQIIFVKKRAFNNSIKSEQKAADQQSTQNDTTSIKPAADLMEDFSTIGMSPDGEPTNDKLAVELLVNNKRNDDPNNAQQHQNVKDLASDSATLIAKTLLIKDASIEMFFKSFVQFEWNQIGGSTSSICNYPEIEDVLLAQTQQQLSVAEFFKLQDQYEVLKEVMTNSIVPETIKRKLLILKTLYECYSDDKLEATNIFLDIVDNSLDNYQRNQNHSMVKKANGLRLMEAYQEFIQSSIYQKFLTSLSTTTNTATSLFQGKEIVNNSQDQKQASFFDLDQNREKAINILKERANLGIKRLDGPLNHHKEDKKILFEMEIRGFLDAHELQMGRLVVDQVLNELRSQGEGKLVDEFIKNKVDLRNSQSTGSQKMEGPFEEINESLKMMLQSLFKQQVNDLAFIDKVILPAILSIEKAN